MKGNKMKVYLWKPIKHQKLWNLGLGVDVEWGEFYAKHEMHVERDLKLSNSGINGEYFHVLKMCIWVRSKQFLIPSSFCGVFIFIFCKHYSWGWNTSIKINGIWRFFLRSSHSTSKAISLRCPASVKMENFPASFSLLYLLNNTRMVNERASKSKSE